MIVAGATALGGKDARTADSPGNRGGVRKDPFAESRLIIPIKLRGVGLRLTGDAMVGREKIIGIFGFVQIVEQTTRAEEFTHHTDGTDPGYSMRGLGPGRFAGDVDIATGRGQGRRRGGSCFAV